jgi:high potential iron-sulfur protein
MHASISRRALLEAGAALSVGVLASHALRGTADAQQKAAKAMVKYQDSPNAGHQCSACSNFVAPDGCKVVDGKISPHGWCTIWTPK